MRAVQEEIDMFKAKIDVGKTNKSEEMQMKLIPVIDELINLQFVDQILI